MKMFCVAPRCVHCRRNLPFAIEDLDAVVFAVAHVDRALRIDRDRVRRVELARLGPLLAPVEQVLAVLRELHHARVPVAVGNVEIAVLRERDVGRAVEGLAVGRGFALDAERHQQLARRA